MRLIFIGLMFVFFTSQVSAQENFVPGWITLPKGDTIKGLIDDRGWRGVDPDAVTFKSQAGEVMTYHPYQITYFGLSNGVYYKSAITLVDNNVRDEVMTGKRPAKAKLDTLFLTVMIKDRLSLYKVTTANEKRHYYIEKDDRLEELVEGYSLVLDPVDKVYKLSVTPSYLGIFSLYTQDCPKVQDKIKQLRLTNSSLLRVVSTYNSCISGAPPKYSQPASVTKGKVRWGLIVGLSVTKMKFKPGDHLYPDVKAMANNNYPATANITFGVSSFITLPGKRNVNGISTELVYYGASSSVGQYQESFNYLRLNLAYRYTFNRDNNKKSIPFIQAGFSTSAMMSHTASNMVEVDSKLFISSDNGVRSIESGAFLGFGVTEKDFTAEIRFERSNGVSDFVDLKSPFTSGYLLFTFKLSNNKKKK